MRGQLLDALGRFERLLPTLLNDTTAWESVDVDYEPPRVERLWRQVEPDVRGFLHRIHPCEHALYHPHPWPSAVKIISGTYEMVMGYGAGETPPPQAVTARLTAGAAYEMADRDAWHSVRPLGVPSLSLMVTGKPWDRWAPRPSHVLRPLTDVAKRELLAQFRAFYP